MGVMTGEELAKALSALYYKAGGRCESSPAVAEGLDVARSGEGVDSLTAGRGVPAGEAATGRLRKVHRAATQLYPPSRCIISAA